MVGDVWERLVKTWSAVHWPKVNWALHCLWAFATLLLWNHIGKSDLNSISVSMTVLQTFLAIMAIGGFWLLRHEVRAKAVEEMDKISEKLVREEVFPRVLRHALDPDKPFEPFKQTSNDLAKEYAKAFGEAEDGR